MLNMTSMVIYRGQYIIKKFIEENFDIEDEDFVLSFISKNEAILIDKEKNTLFLETDGVNVYWK